MKAFILHIMPVSGRCQNLGGKRALVGCDDTSVGQQINPALKIHDCIHKPSGLQPQWTNGTVLFFKNTPRHTSTEVKTDVNMLKGFSVNQSRQRHNTTRSFRHKHACKSQE